MVTRTAALLLGALALWPIGASAQQDSSRLVRVTGRVASIRTTNPVAQADVRLFYVDSVHLERDTKDGAGEIFVDSSRSRVAVTDSAGAFAIRGMPSGRYLVHVRRLGFTPIEAFMKVDTLAVDLEFAMTQIDAMLPEYRVTASASYMDRAIRAMDRSGFTERAKAFGTGRFIPMSEISKARPTLLSDYVAKYGVRPSDIFILDGIGTTWDDLRNFPPQLIVGIEIYRTPAMAPIGVTKTVGGGQAFGELSKSGMEDVAATGGLKPKVVMLWSYIP